MISFIVIGKNEGKRLEDCFEGIYKTISLNEIKDYEIIFVDSNSTDKSIEIAKSFDEIVIYKITKNEGASVGRNIGAKHSKGNILFFVDGDMVLNPEFTKKILDENKHLIYDFVAGEYIYVLHDSKWNFLREQKYHSMLSEKQSEKAYKSNGCFVIKKQHWNALGGLDERFIKASTEDMDFIFRAHMSGIPLIRIKEIMTHHILIDHNEPKLLWSSIFSGRQILGRTLLWRKNIFNPYSYPFFIRQEYTSIILFISLVLARITLDYRLVLLYPIVTLIRSIARSKKRLTRICHFWGFFLIRDLGINLAWMLFSPIKKKVEYKRIK